MNYKQRSCIRCGAEVLQRKHLCSTCGIIAAKERQMNKQRNRVIKRIGPEVLKKCLDCDSLFPIGTKRVRCMECAEKHHRLMVEKRNQEKRKSKKESETI